MNTINSTNVSPDALLAQVEGLEANDAMQALAMESRQVQVNSQQAKALRVEIAKNKDDIFHATSRKKKLQLQRNQISLQGLADKFAQKLQAAFSGMRNVVDSLDRSNGRLATAREDLSATSENAVTDNQIGTDNSLAASGGQAIAGALKAQVTNDRDLKMIFDITRNSEHARAQSELSTQSSAITKQLKAMAKMGKLGFIFKLVNAVVLPAITLATAGAAGALAPAVTAVQKAASTGFMATLKTLAQKLALTTLNPFVKAGVNAIEQVPMAAAQKQVTGAQTEQSNSSERSARQAKAASEAQNIDAQTAQESQKITDRLEAVLQAR